MSQTYYQILAAGLIFFLLLVAFWPNYGLYSRWQRLLKQQNHTLLQEALKHIYECERNRKTCTVNSLCFTRFLGNTKALRLLKQLQESGLIEVENTSINLTPDGKEQALQIVRFYRILGGSPGHNTIRKGEVYAGTAGKIQKDEIE